MASRFQQSTFRNTILSSDKNVIIQFEANQPYVNTPSACPIKASSDYIAYRTGANGSSIGIIKSNSKGKTFPEVIAGPTTINDIDWCKLSASASILASATENSVNIYNVSTGNSSPLISCKTPAFVDTLLFHPRALDLISFSTESSFKIWNYASDKMVFNCNISKPVKSFSWNSDGSLVVTSTFDNELKVFDPRTLRETFSQKSAHFGSKPCSVVWGGNTNVIVTVGFDNRRNREFALWDVRASRENPLQKTTIDSAQSSLNSIYDPDTNLLFICGKGDSKISWMEIEAGKTAALAPTPFMSQSTISGFTLMPKFSLEVMQGEVNRILTIQQHGIVPISAKVPRKSYYEFHNDLFPPTLPEEKFLGASAWCAGKTGTTNLVSLNPKTEAVYLCSASDLKPSRNSSLYNDTTALSTPLVQGSKAKISLPKHSYYRHVATDVKTVIDDIKIGSPIISNETNGFETNGLFLGFFIAGNGGRLGITLASFQGRMASKISCSEMHDFKFDPFDKQIVATACDDGKIRFFRIPLEGLQDDFLVAESVISAHHDRTSILLFHSTIKSMLLSCSPGTGSAEIKLWNTKDLSCMLTIPQTDMVLSCCFDLLGSNLVSLGKDQKLSIFNLKTGDLIKDTKSHTGGKSARVFWLANEKSLVSVGFGSGSQRELIVYNENDFQNPLVSLLDSSPSQLIPFYDIDTSVLLLIGRGESTVSYYEIVDDAPVYLNRYQISSGNTASFACLPKTSVNVKDIEIIAGYRLSQNSIDKVSVSVPRIKKEYFQDDIFPDTIDYQSSSITVNDWLNNVKISLKYKSMRPNNMTNVSDVLVESSKKCMLPTFDEVISEERKKDEAMRAMFDKAKLNTDGPLKQDLMEGVADDEW